MRSMGMVALLGMAVLLVAGSTSAQGNWENSPKYQVVPGKGIGPVLVGMTVERASLALLAYGRVVHHENPGASYQAICAQPDDNPCAYTSDGKVVDSVQAFGNSDYWIAQKGGDSLHLLSAGAQHFVKEFGHPSCQRTSMSGTMKMMMLGWEKAGVAGAFYADSGTLMVSAVLVAKPGEVCSQ